MAPPRKSLKRRQQRRIGGSKRRKVIKEREASEDEGEQQLSVDEEVKYWEDKLGIHGENNEKVKQEFIKDGWDEDFFQSLDAIDDAVKERKRDLDRSEPSRQEMAEEDSPDDDEEAEDSENSADEEVEYWEHKLGIDKNRQKVMEELERDGLDADLFTALDNIEDAVKSRKKELKGPKNETSEEQGRVLLEEVPEASAESKETGAYVPPHLRTRKSTTTAEEERALKLSKIRGLVNKLSEGNIELITAEIVSLLSDDDPTIVDGYAREFVDSAIGNPHISLTLLGTYCAHIVAITMLSGGRPLAIVIELIGTFVRENLPNVSDDTAGSVKAQISNCCKVIALVFTFGAVSPNVVIDLIRFIFTPNDMHRLDLVLVVLRFAGRKLRKDNLQDFSEILEVLTKDSNVAGEASGKYQFLLGELENLRNNKVNFTALSHFEANFGWLKSSNLLKGRGTPEDSLLQVPVNMFDPEQVDRLKDIPWWRGASGGIRVTATTSKAEDSEHARLLKLAAKMKMNTDLRKSIFIALMGAEDYKHAVFRLGQVIGSRPKLVPQVAVVLLHCAIHENSFNRYYCRVGKALTELPGTWGSRYSHALRNALTKLLQQCHTYPVKRVGILAKIAAFMIVEGVVDLTILRFLDFASAETGDGRVKLDVLIRELIIELIDRKGDETAKLFECVGKYSDLHDGLEMMVESLVLPKLPTEEQSRGKAIIAVLKECKVDEEDGDEFGF